MKLGFNPLNVNQLAFRAEKDDEREKIKSELDVYSHYPGMGDITSEEEIDAAIEGKKDSDDYQIEKRAEEAIKKRAQFYIIKD